MILIVTRELSFNAKMFKSKSVVSYFKSHSMTNCLGGNKFVNEKHAIML